MNIIRWVIAKIRNKWLDIKAIQEWQKRGIRVYL